MKEPEKIIMRDSDEAAKLVTVTGWASSTGRFFGNGPRAEIMARYEGSTHHKCECGGIAKKSYTVCDKCIEKNQRERYMAMPYKEWCGEPVCDRNGDEYFFNEEDLITYMEEHEIESIQLTFCEPNHFQHLDGSYWADVMPTEGDGEFPKQLRDAIDALNNVIETLPVASYKPGKIRTSYTLEKDSDE